MSLSTAFDRPILRELANVERQWLYMFAAFGGAGSMLATSFAQPNAIWQQFLAQSLLFGITVAYGVQVSSPNTRKSEVNRIENRPTALLLSAQPFQHAALWD